MTGNAIFIAVMAGLLLVGSIPLLVLFRNLNARTAARAEALRSQGRETSGEVERVWRTSGKESHNMVRYAFSANGVRLQGESRVPPSLWNGVRKSGFLPIRYLPSDPNINHPAGWEDRPDAAWMQFILPGVMAISGIVLVITLRRQAEMTAEGLPAVGVVTRCVSVKGGWAVRYRFRMKGGAVASGASQVRRRMEVGATICVLYLPQNPRRNQVYPTTLYRVTQ